LHGSQTQGASPKGRQVVCSYIKYKREYDLYVVNYGATYTDLENAANGYQRNFQISILSVLVVWGVQVVDAYIDAKVHQRLHGG
jgi:hypothetical protein